jgi:hypothetical protein
MSYRKLIFELSYVLYILTLIELLFVRKMCIDINTKGVFLPSDGYGEMHMKLVRSGEKLVALDRQSVVGVIGKASISDDRPVGKRMNEIIKETGSVYVNVDRSRKVLLLYSNRPTPQSAFRLRSAPGDTRDPVAFLESLDSLMDASTAGDKKLLGTVVYLAFAGFFPSSVFLVYPRSIVILDKGRRRRMIAYDIGEHIDAKGLPVEFTKPILIAVLMFIERDVIVMPELAGMMNMRYNFRENDIYQSSHNFNDRNKEAEMRDIIARGEYEGLMPMIDDEQRRRGMRMFTRLVSGIYDYFRAKKMSLLLELSRNG